MKTWAAVLDIVFLSDQDARTYNDSKMLTRIYGPDNAKRIRRRLDDLAAAPTLEAM